MLARSVSFLFFLIAEMVSADCFDAAAERHRVPADLLRAIACVESNLNPLAFNQNPNGSTDYGVMQINSIWLPTLSNFGFERDHLWDPCTNIDIGAWVLDQMIRVFGFNWRAIGAYNAGLRDTPLREHLRYEYAKKVYRVIERGC